MAKKKESEKLPSTKAKTAEDRLEELIMNKSITRFRVANRGDEANIFKGEVKRYIGGLEFLEDEREGVLYIEKGNYFIIYNPGIEHKKTKIKGKT